MKMLRRSLPIALAVALLVTGVVLAKDTAAEKEMAAIRAAMADRNYPDAARRLTEYIDRYRTGDAVEEAGVLLVRARLGVDDFERALEAGRLFLAEHAGSSWERKVRYLMAEAWAKMRRFEDAARIYREQVDFLTGDRHLGKVAGYYLDLARTAYEGVEKPDEFGRMELVKDYHRALDYYRKARGIHLPDGTDALVAWRIGDAAYRLGETNTAVTEWTRLLEEHPDAAEADEATYFLGEALLKQGKVAEARRYLRQVREKWGDSPWAPESLILLGDSFQPLSTRDEEALARGLGYWERYRELYPSHEKAEEVFFRIGEAEYRFGHFDAAIEQLGLLLDRFPAGEHAPNAKDLIAWSHYRSDRFDEAIRTWKDFLGEWPNHELWTKVQGMISQAAFAKGARPLSLVKRPPDAKAPALLDRAEAGFRSFLATYPVNERSPEAQLQLGTIAFLREDWSKAEEEWRITATKYAESGQAASALFAIGGMQDRKQGELGKAIETYEELVRRFPASSEARTARQLLDRFREKHLEVKTERSYTTDEAVKLRVRTRNIESLKIRAWRIDLEERFRTRRTLAEIESVVAQIFDPDLTQTAAVADYEKYRLFEREIVLDAPIPGKPGAWIVNLEEDDLTASTLVLVTDLTIVTKEAPGQTLVYAVNERTGRPWPGAEVLLAFGGKIRSTGKTGPNGVWLENHGRNDPVRVFGSADGNSGAGNSGAGNSGAGNWAFTELQPGGRTGFGYRPKIYLYTDRPLYRPGQDVELKGIYRNVSGGSYVVPSGEELTLEVRDPRDTVALSEKVKANEYGTFASKLWLPEGAAIGTWRIVATTKRGQTFTGGFVVREYKKPEFTITARTDRRTYLTTEKVKVDVALRYFFGGPVPKTKVRYAIGYGPFEFDPSVHDEFAWFSLDPEQERKREQREQAGVDWIQEGELVTDEDGNAELEFDTLNDDPDYRYLIFFEALDLNRQWVRESASVVATSQAYYAMLKTEKKVYRPEEEIDVRVTTVDALQFPVARKGELQVIRRSFADGRENPVVVARVPAVTGEDGMTTVKVKAPRAGEYRLRFVGEDRAKNPVFGDTLVTAEGESEDLAKQAKVVASRQIYREGETAEVLVLSPVAPAWALLTFEGEKVLRHRVVELTSRSTTLELPMDNLYSPNVFVKVAIPKGHELHEAGDEIYVFKYLDVTVTPDERETVPGGEMAFTVKTADQRGRPVSAEVSFALFDRSILGLQPDTTPQIKPFFYDQRRVLSVATGSSHTFHYDGTTSPTNADLRMELLRQLGPEKYRRIVKQMNQARAEMGRGDLEGAAITLRKLLEEAPGHSDARAMLARLQTQVESRRVAELASRLKEKLGFLEEREEAVSERRRKNERFFGGRAGSRPASDAPAEMAEPAPATEPSSGAWANKKMVNSLRRDRLSDAKNGRDKNAGGEFHDRTADGDVRGRREQVYTLQERQQQAGTGFRFGTLSFGDVPVAGYAFSPPLVPAELREKFADTASFRPRVVTDAEGTARVTVELPDNLTTWQAVVRGVTRETLVGEARSELVARKDLLVRIDAPRFLTQTDDATVTATVHNNLPEGVAVDLTFSGENVAVRGDGKENRRLEPREIRSFDFELAATDQGLARIRADALTRVASDAARSGLPVYPHGLKTLVGRSGAVEDAAYESFTLPDGIIPGTKRMHLVLSPGIDGSILESLVWLGGFPYGCLEQTVNRFLPAIAAREALRAIGSPNAKLAANLDETVERGLLALYSFQNPDGSFGWFRAGRRPDGKAVPGDATMTALALLAIERARIAEFRVSAPNRERAIAAAANLVKASPDNADKALLLYALSLAGRAGLEDLNQVYRYRDGLDAYSLAVLSLAMHETRRTAQAAALANLLEARAVTDADLAFWAAAGEHGVRNSVETTAWALRALLATEPENLMIGRAARWLILHKRGGRWTSTRDTGAAILALSDYLVREGVSDADYEVQVFLDDGAVPYQKIRVAGGRVADENERFVIVDGARLKTGENRIRLVKTGPGRLFYTMHLEYAVAADHVPADGNLVKVGRRYVEYVSPLALEQGVQEIKPGWTIVRPEARPKEDDAAPVDRAGSGDKFRVKIGIDARERLPYVIVEDPLPAGVEVVDGQATGPFDWEERRDEKQVFFLTNVPEGKTEITYLAQAIHPGRYHAMPTLVYPMYEPAVWGRSEERILSVSPEPGVIGRPETPEGVTPDEIYQVAVRDFGRGEYERARDALARLVAEFRLLDRYEEECRAMLMRANFELGNHRRAVESYERLVELNPRRGPKTTEERRQLAAAYQGIGEAERALVLFAGVAGEGFALESEVADTYRGIGQLHEAQAFSERLVRSYPDLNAVVATDYRNALRYLELREPGSERGELPRLMLPEARESLAAFLSHHPGSSFADQAGRMAVTVLDRLDRTHEAIAEAGKFLRRYPASDQRDDVLYYLAAAYYEKGDYDKVFATGKRILGEKFFPRPGAKEKEKSPYRSHVTYLFARIHHQRGELAEAVHLYRQVAGQFEDARDALAFLTAEALEVPDTSVFPVGEAVRLPVRRKNIEGLDLRTYEVDLMRLIAVNKDLRDASGIDLTGIATENRIEREFEGGKDFRWHEEEIPLSLTGKGVYLVVARAGDRATSGLVLVSDLDISVQEVGNRVRVYAVDRKTREPVRDVFVKISDGREIRAQGFTDARGVFEGQKGSGPLMVVAEKKGDFALYRR